VLARDSIKKLQKELKSKDSYNPLLKLVTFYKTGMNFHEKYLDYLQTYLKITLEEKRPKCLSWVRTILVY